MPRILTEDVLLSCRHHHPNLARKVDVIYALAQAWTCSNDDGDFEMLEKYLSALKPEETILVRRTRCVTTVIDEIEKPCDS